MLLLCLKFMSLKAKLLNCSLLISLVFPVSVYTPGIYADGYIVFAFPFVRSSARMFVSSFVRSFVSSLVQ